MLEGLTVQNKDWLSDQRGDIAPVTRYREVGGNQQVLSVAASGRTLADQPAAHHLIDTILNMRR